MTIQQALRHGTGILKAAGIETPAVEAGVVLCFVKNCDKTYIYAHGEEELSIEEYDRYCELTGARAKGKPLQYIIGRQEFMSLEFSVNEAVLIPRHDTEILVETVIKYAKIKNRPAVSGLHILDIGTGSGCIAVSLAYYIEKCRITALDVSSKALDVARMNAFNNGVADRIGFINEDIFKYWCDNCGNTADTGEHKNAFDVVVSNPPYIPSGDISGLQTEVRDYEPLNALDGGAGGLDFYRFIIRNSKYHLRPLGLLAFEVGFEQARDVAELMRDEFCDVEVIKDLSGIDRVVTGKLKDVE